MFKKAKLNSNKFQQLNFNTKSKRFQTGSENTAADAKRTKGLFHKSWALGANHRDSSIKVGRMVQSALYASKKLLKSWA